MFKQWKSDMVYLISYEPKRIGDKVIFERNGLIHNIEFPAILIINPINKSIGWKSYYVNGELHREDGPAEIIYDNDGRLTCENFYKNNKPRDSSPYEDTPGKITYYDDGQIEKIYYNNSMLIKSIIINSNGIIVWNYNHVSKDNEPTIIEWYDDGTIKSEKYEVDYRPHRLEGPAAIYYDENGVVRIESYYYNGNLHRPSLSQGGGPAIIKYDKYGNIGQELYYYNGKLHRPVEEGPAEIIYGVYGMIHSVEFYVDGKRPSNNRILKEKYYDDLYVGCYTAALSIVTFIIIILMIIL